MQGWGGGGMVRRAHYLGTRQNNKAGVPQKASKTGQNELAQ